MSYLNMDWCSRQEYETGSNYRIMPNNLVIDEMYFLMLALRTNPKHQQCRPVAAVSKACEIHAVTQDHSGLFVVEFDIYDDELVEEMTDVEAVFDEEGYWTNPQQILRVGSFMVRTGYIQQYYDPRDALAEQFFANEM